MCYTVCMHDTASCVLKAHEQCASDMCVRGGVMNVGVFLLRSWSGVTTHGMYMLISVGMHNTDIHTYTMSHVMYASLQYTT